MLKKIWHDPVWSKVIAGILIILATGGSGSYFLGWWPIIKAFFRYRINVPIWILTVIGFLWLVLCLLLAALFKIIRDLTDARRVLRFVPLDRQRWWHLAKQRDESLNSQLSLYVQVTNISSNPVRILKIRLIKPKAKIIHAEASLPVEGTPYHSFEHPVRPGGTTTASIHVMTYGKLADQGSSICVTLGITDQYGQEYILKNITIETHDRPVPKNVPKKLTDSTPPKMLWKYNLGTESINICDAILREEQRNYAACGRGRGGLGSLNVGLQSEPNYGVPVVGNVPILLWKKDHGLHISSPNLERLLRTYETLGDPDKDNLNQYLLSQLSKESSFADVAYFVFLALHRIGKTIDALKTARTFLAGDKVYGYSNLL